MRIGLLIYGSLDTLSGGYLYDCKLVEHLRRQGDQVEVISLPWRNYMLHLGDNLSRELLRDLEQRRLDILLQDELNHPSLFYMNLRLRRRARYPLISIVHHLLSSEPRSTWQNRLYGIVERRYLQSVDGFIFNSQTTRREVRAQLRARLRARVGDNGQPGIVAYPGGDRLAASMPADQIAVRTRQAGPLRVFFLGNVIPRKGLHTLVEALSHLPGSLCTLTIAGGLEFDRAYARAIKKQVAALDLQDRVRFSGPLQEQALVEQFQSSHVLALPSSYEGFGIAYLEGMAFGLPAIATSAGAAGEIITHGRDGFLISPGDSQALARHLNQLATDRQLLLALSLAARERFEAHPTWDQAGGAIREFLVDFPSHERAG
jgi:glycosyltransferase involved in cell wall biosynthesis